MYSAVQRPELRPGMMVKRPPMADARFFKKSPPAKMPTIFKK
jgi:hypothetical protein